MKPALLVGVLIAVAVGTMACFLFRKSRIWSELKQTQVSLDGLANVTVPADLRYDSEAVRHDGDTAQFRFQRVNDHHLNGMTSYAENLLIIKGHPELIQAYRQNFLAHKAHSKPPQVKPAGDAHAHAGKKAA